MKQRCHARTLTGLPCRRDAKFQPERARFAYCHDHHRMWARFEPAGPVSLEKSASLPALTDASSSTEASGETDILSMYETFCNASPSEASIPSQDELDAPGTPKKRSSSTVLEASVTKKPRSPLSCSGNLIKRLRGKQPEHEQDSSELELLKDKPVDQRDVSKQAWTSDQLDDKDLFSVLRESMQMKSTLDAHQTPLVCYGRRSRIRTN